MRIVAGWLYSESQDPFVIRQVPTKNFNARPQHEISLIVIHGISLPPRQYGGSYIDRLFTNCLDPSDHPYFAAIYKLELSTHVLIRRDGSITQYVSFIDRAWHAGRSAYLGQEECNEYGIGIELEGCDDERYTDEQYQTLNALITVLVSAYPEIDSRYWLKRHQITTSRKAHSPQSEARSPIAFEGDGEDKSDSVYRIAYHSEVAPGRKTDPGEYFEEGRLVLARKKPVWSKSTN